MINFLIFGLSGAAITLLILTKIIEKKHHTSFFVSRIISSGDANMRKLSHSFTHLYSEFKDKAEFFFRKQLPMHSKKLWYKVLTITQEAVEKNLEKMRDVRLIKHKKQDISDYFKSISDSEKTNGEINNDLEGGSQIEKKEIE